MPTVPVRRLPEQQLRALGAPFQSTDVSADAFGAGAARDLQQAGQGLQAIGADLGDEALRLQIERNEAAASEADALFSDRVREGLYGESGYHRLSGRDAVFGGEAARQQLRTAVDEIAAGLPTDEARDLFRRAAAPQLTRALGAIDRHSISEHRTYANNASIARYESALLDVDQAADLTGAAERGMAMARAVTDEQADRLGWSRAQRDQILREREAEVGARYVTRLAHTDPARAIRELGIPSTTAVPLTRGDAPVSTDTIEIPPQTGAWGDRHVDESLAVGVNPNVTFAIARSESGFQNVDTGIRGPDGAPASDATGPWQYISSTWRNLIAQHPELGLTMEDRRDPEAQAIMTAHAVADITRSMERALGRPIDGADLYLGWFVGEGNAIRLLRSGDMAIADSVIPDERGGWLSNHGYDPATTTVGDIRARLGAATGLAGVPVRWGEFASPPAAHRIPSAAPANRFVGAMSYEQRAQAARIAERQLEAASAGQRADLEERIRQDRAMYRAGEQPPNPTTRADLIDAWGPEEGQRRWEVVAHDQAVGGHLSTVRGMPPERQQEYLESLRPRPGADFIQQQDAFEAVEDELTRQRAINAAILEPRLQNEINMLQSGMVPPDPITRADLATAMPPDEVDAAWSELQAIREAEALAAGQTGRTPEQTQALLARLQPVAGEDFTRQAQIYQRAVEAAQLDAQRRADDPAGYVSSYNAAVRNAYETAQTPQDMRLAMQMSWAAQTEAGIPIEQRRPLTAAAVGWLAGQWTNASGAERVALLHSVTADLGDPLMFRAALRQITEDAGIPTGAAIVIASMDMPTQRSGASLLAEIANTSTADLRNLIGTGEGGQTTPVNEAVAGNEDLASFAASLAFSTFAGDDPLSVVVTEQTQRLAYYLVSRGETPQDAVDQAVDQIIGQHYAFGETNGETFRVPTVVDTAAVIGGAAAVLQRPEVLAAHVGAVSLVSVNPELQDEAGQAIVQDQGRRSIQTQARWITSPDERGLVLMWQDGNAVQREDGTVVLLTWAQLAEIGNSVPLRPLERAQASGNPLLEGRR